MSLSQRTRQEASIDALKAWNGSKNGEMLYGLRPPVIVSQWLSSMDGCGS